jgi:hypothetical protein
VDENFAMDDITKHKVIKTAEYFITWFIHPPIKQNASFPCRKIRRLL